MSSFSRKEIYLAAVFLSAPTTIGAQEVVGLGFNERTVRPYGKSMVDRVFGFAPSCTRPAQNFSRVTECKLLMTEEGGQALRRQIDADRSLLYELIVEQDRRIRRLEQVIEACRAANKCE